ncbi:hypothetical protein DYB32_008800 [Aphanomyces invadans]|uniref:Arp2/3 complex 41 kDa subunit n=1 Tax=Aphanomyces invadans TaxID=157072 RepID=A0A418AKB9_9STRA|nr:hypothetical protein DYB32_008800 [Aphanomyces invadans]
MHNQIVDMGFRGFGGSVTTIYPVVLSGIGKKISPPYWFDGPTMSVFNLTDSITCHAWNRDRSKVAICPNTNEIWIYSNCHAPDASQWRKEAVLTEHDMVVSGLDWSPVHDMLVSCSHDRSAFVWKYEPSERKWKPSLVVLRITRAAMTVKWSPDGKKFAVGSSAKCVSVCYYVQADNWWISKVIKKHKSTYAYLHTHSSPCMFPHRTITIRFSHLPLTRLLFLSNDAVVGCGHDFNLLLFTTSAQGFWSFSELLDKKSSAGTAAKADNSEFNNGTKKDSSSVGNKLNVSGDVAVRKLWDSKVNRGQSAEATSGDKGALWTKHENTITSIQVLKASPNGHVTEFSTSGLDGRVVTWKLNSLNLDMAKLRL